MMVRRLAPTADLAAPLHVVWPAPWAILSIMDGRRLTRRRHCWGASPILVPDRASPAPPGFADGDAALVARVRRRARRLRELVERESRTVVRACTESSATSTRPRTPPRRPS
jgi:hypothetical protein